MSDEVKPSDANVPRMETNIVIEAPRKSLMQAIVTWLVRTIVLLVLLAAGGYVFLNFTPAGEELKDKYERKCRETRQQLDDGIEFCRFYISHFGHPPASHEEVIKFQTERVSHPFTQYRLPNGKNLPYWNGKDGFGREIAIHVNPQTRTIKLVSPGFLPLTGDTPAFFDCVRETSY